MNCIWITTDSFRQDHVNAYRPEGTLDATGDGFRVHTPNLDKLAEESVLFERMLAEALPTIPQRRGVFTGKRTFPWPDEPKYKGIYPDFPGWRPIPQDDVTVAEHLSDQGYVTAMVADAYHMFKPSMNMHRGFDGFEWVRGQEFDRWRTAPLPPGRLEQHLLPGKDLPGRRTRVLTQFLRNHEGVADEDLPAARTFRWAIDWVQRNQHQEKFFLYVDTFSPHEPWLPPQRFLDLYDADYGGNRLIYGNPYHRSDFSDEEHHHLRARYAGCCTMVDHWVGELLRTVDRLGLRENTLIVLISDHGKIVGEFDHYGMPSVDISPVLARVPCFIRNPEDPHAGQRFAGQLYNTDVVATTLALLGVEPKPGVEGEDVWPAVVDGYDAFRDVLVTGYREMVCAWRGDWLYLVNTREDRATLFNVAEDVHRQNDMADRYPDVRNELARAMAAVTG